MEPMLTTFLPLATLIIGGALSVGRLLQKLSALEETMKAWTIKLDALTAMIQRHDTDVAVMGTRLNAIEKDLHNLTRRIMRVESHPQHDNTQPLDSTP